MKMPSLHKSELREKLLKIQKNNYASESDKSIAEIVKSFITNGKCEDIFIYRSKQYEIDTVSVIQFCFQNNIGVAVPRVNGSSMNFYYISSFDDTEQGHFGVYEPKKYCKQASVGQHALLIAPCLAVNKKGFRIGYGKGYYDRYLEEHGHITKAALCYERNILDFTHDFFDVRMDYIITEKVVYSCST
ncbi:MAG: 5-formyltetrahydrofolate cyclo-ligase [Clostridiales bacterium]|nr:5-formyltetrahydrofolate cyclo-ligase [Clostridiales bacterium]